MSLTQALTNAAQGLNATSRATEIVATNIANAQTDGYVRRSVVTTERVVDGNSLGLNPITVKRNDAERASFNVRRADITFQYQSEIAKASENLQRQIGDIDSEFSLSSRMDTFRNALKNLAETPENGSLQEQAVLESLEFSRSVRDTAAFLQELRENADAAIALEVDLLNQNLQRLQDVNSDIASLSNSSDISGLLDEQERLLNSINEVIPVNVRPQDNGTISLATKGGITLLDINISQIEFTNSPVITADKVYAFTGEEPGLPFDATLSGLTISGLDLTPTANRIQSISGGKLAGLFEIRDEFTTTYQRQLDSIAGQMITSFRDLDPTIGTNLDTITAGNGTISTIDASADGSNTLTLDLSAANGARILAVDTYEAVLDFDNGTDSSALTATITGADLTRDQLADTISSVFNAVKNGDALSTSTTYAGVDTDITYGGSAGVFTHNGATITLNYNDNTGGLGTITEGDFVTGLNGSGTPAEDLDITNTTAGQIDFANNSLTASTDQDFSISGSLTIGSTLDTETAGDGTVSAIDASAAGTDSYTLDFTGDSSIGIRATDTYATTLDFDDGTDSSALTATISGANLTREQLADTVSSIFNAVKNGDALTTSTSYTGADTDIAYGNVAGVFFHNGARIALTYNENTGGAGTIDEATFVAGLNGSGTPAEDLDITNAVAGQIVFANNSLTAGTDQDFSISGTVTLGPDEVFDSLFTAGDPGADYTVFDNTLGIANSFIVNSKFDPNQGGDRRRIRDGAEAAVLDVAEGNGDLLQSWIGDMEVLKTFDPSTELTQTQSLISSVREFVANSSLGNLNIQNQLSYEESNRNILMDVRDNQEGVNIDEQTQQILFLQRIYQANAVLMQTIDEMMESILRI